MEGVKPAKVRQTLDCFLQTSRYLGYVVMDIRPEVMNLYLVEVAARLDHSYCGVDVGTCPSVCKKLNPPVTPAAGSVKKAEKIVSGGGLTTVQFNTVKESF